MDNMKVIARHTYMRNLRSFSFLALVFGPLIFIAVILMIRGAVEGEMMGQDHYGKVVYVTDDPHLGQIIDDIPSQNDIKVDQDKEAGLQALVDENIDLLVEVDTSKNRPYLNVHMNKGGDRTNISLENALIENYFALQHASEQPIHLDQLVDVESQWMGRNLLEVERDSNGRIQWLENSENLRLSIAYIFNALFLLMVMVYMSIITKELAREKGNRIMEVIITSMRAEDHYWGKLIGLFLLVLTHVAFYGALNLVFLGLNQVFQWTDFSIGALNTDLFTIITDYSGLILVSIIYAVLGCVIYLSLAIFLASLASRVEDGHTMDGPLRTLLIIGAYTGIFAVYQFNATIVVVLSHIPFFTPFIMPLRMATHSVHSWEIVVSIIVCVLFVVACIHLGSRFYKTNVLSYSDQGWLATFRQSLGLIKSQDQSAE